MIGVAVQSDARRYRNLADREMVPEIERAT